MQQLHAPCGAPAQLDLSCVRATCLLCGVDDRTPLGDLFICFAAGALVEVRIQEHASGTIQCLWTVLVFSARLKHCSTRASLTPTAP